MKRAIVAGLFALAHRAVSALPLLVSNTDVLDTYDYVVVGGGTGGMTLANRLSEDGSSMSYFFMFKGPPGLPHYRDCSTYRGWFTVSLENLKLSAVA